MSLLNLNNRIYKTETKAYHILCPYCNGVFNYYIEKIAGLRFHLYKELQTCVHCEKIFFISVITDADDKERYEYDYN